MLSGPPGEYDRKVETRLNGIEVVDSINTLKGKKVNSTKMHGYVQLDMGLLSPNWRGNTTRGGGCGLIGFNARNLSREDSRMRVTLKGLPDKLRSAAWPSSVRAVKCRLK